MSVEDAPQRIWFWFYMSPQISAMGSVRYIQKDMDEVVRRIRSQKRYQIGLAIH
jgi:hypothetical protein